MALEAERVGQEAQQLARVVDAAVAQVLERLRDRARRRQRELGQLRVGLGFAAEQDQRDAVALADRAQRRHALRPGALAAQQADDDDPRAGHERLDVIDGVRRPHLGEARAELAHGVGRGEDLRVGGRQETEQAITGGLSGAPRWMRSSRAGASTCSPNQSARRSRWASRTAAKAGRAGRPLAAAAFGDPGQQAAAERVALEQAVPARAENVTTLA